MVFNEFLNYLTLFAAIANFLLGLFVISRGPRKLNIYFSLFSFLTAIWVFTNFYFFLNPSTFNIKMQYATGALVVPAAVLWVFYLINKYTRNLLVYLTVALGISLSVIVFIDGWVIDRLRVNPDGSHDLVPGPFFNLYGFLLFLPLVIFFYELIKGYRRGKALERIQMRYLLIGSGIFTAVGIFVNFTLPLLGYIPVAALDAQASLIFVALSTYAILRHRLLDIVVIIKRATIFALILVILGLAVFIFASRVPYWLSILFPEFFGPETVQEFFHFGVPFLLALAFPWIRRWAENVTDRWFFKRPYDPDELLDHLAQTISSIINLPHLVDATTQILVSAFKVERAYFFVREDPATGSGLFRIRNTVAYPYADDKVLRGHDPLIVYWDRFPNETIVVEELRGKMKENRQLMKELGPVVRELDKLHVVVGMPILSKEKLVGVVLFGEKRSGDIFASQDLRILELFSHQMGVAIENAKLFEEQKDFAERLKLEVARATQDLQVSNVALAEKNKNLASLQKITSVITRTLDLEQVTQTIADSIADELGYIGGAILFVEEDRERVSVRAITRTPIAEKAVKLLGKPLEHFAGDLTTDDNLSLRAIKTGKIQVGISLEEFTRPRLTGALAQAIQKLTGLKTMIAVPIFSENEVIGAIDFALEKGRGEVREGELEMMKALSNQMGIIVRNLRLYQEVRAYSERLEKVNEYLQQLDKTKSEFISIASHQLRSPLTGIKGYLSMILEGDFGSITVPQKKVLSDLFEHTEQLVRLVNLFLNVSRIEAGRFTVERTKSRIEAIITDVLEQLGPQARAKKLALEFLPPRKALPELWIDADKIRDVVVNYVDNAIKYTQAGKVTVSVAIAGSDLVVGVKDTGIGVPREDLVRLFEKFARAQGIALLHPEGTGLGLYIAKKIVEAHGGKVWAESAGAGKGSTFFFSLPTS